MRIAIVGSGISGLGAAWALHRDHDITVFEAASRLGGHANTVDVGTGKDSIAVDTGFIVYNEVTYPHLTRLFSELDVPTEESDMSFSLSINKQFEYASSVVGILAQPSNLLRKRFRQMLRDINRFRRIGATLDPDPGETIGHLLERHGFSTGFAEDYLFPMTGAIWSARTSTIAQYPAASILRFLSNHGLIAIKGRPQWRTVTGGSREYVNRLVAPFADRIRLARPVVRIERSAGGVELMTPGGTESFDQVVLATHSDQSRRILGNEATADEDSLLGAIRYEENFAVLHSDPALMPQRRSTWSSWNSAKTGADAQAAVTYWMNKLQNLDERMPLFVSLNPPVAPDPALVHGEFSYAHPQFDIEAIAAQAGIAQIQGRNNTWFAGAYLGYGFHEDGLQSGLNVAAALGSPPDWYDSVEPMSSARRPSGEVLSKR